VRRTASRTSRSCWRLRCAWPPATGPCVWTAQQLGACPDSWRGTLSTAELRELEAAAASVEAQPLHSVDAVRFSGPLGERLRSIRGALYHGRGVSLLRGLPVGDWSPARCAATFWLLGAALGSPVPQNRAGQLLGHVKDVGADAARPETRLYQTAVAQPFHTDSCDVVGLLCLQTALSGGQSQVVSSSAVFNTLLARSPHLARVLTEPFHNDRKGEVPPGKQQTFQMPVFMRNPANTRWLSMYDRSFINAAHARWQHLPPMTESQLEALDAADAIADELRLDMSLQPGDMQWLHNHQIWHARSAFSDGGEERSRRHLLRLWLAAPPEDAWDLPAVFAERYGTIERDAVPPRGGIRCEGAQLCAPLTAERVM